ncbi:MAG: hypothetical protein ACXADH_05550 [Candidatus Kariarchaeaceae archaeon]|jgi:hypothetical protein
MIAKVLNAKCVDGIQGDECRVPSIGSTETDRFVEWIIYHLMHDPENAILITREGKNMVARYEVTKKGLAELSNETPEKQ